jgi:hypothetical protein
MSREAIAAALAREDLSCCERLVAFSLASFADRQNRARPGTLAAAGRTGLARSRFLEARDRLGRRGLVVVEQAATGRGRAGTLMLRFADAGPWWDGEINPELFEAVLGYSRSRGPARLLLAVMAALADEQGVVEGLTTERLCAAAGVADRTYRRARARLLASGELVLRGGLGGRRNTNCWEIPDPRTRPAVAPPARSRRVPPPAGARPLIATVDVPLADEPHQLEPVSAEVMPDSDGHAVGTVKGGQDRTVSGETPAETPAKTPAPNARAGREPQNARTTDPPCPPEGGSVADRVLVEETYVTERGRTRLRRVAVDPGGGARPTVGGGESGSHCLGGDPGGAAGRRWRQRVRDLAGAA